MAPRSVEVLYLSYDGLTDILGQSQILPYLRGLSLAGYSFTIVSFEKRDKFKKYYSEIDMICRDHKVDWRPLPYHKSPSVLSTVYDLLVLRKTVRKLAGEKQFKIVHCRSYLTSLIGLWVKRRLGLKFIFDMRGFWPDERIDGGLWNLNNPLHGLIYKFFKRKEKEFIKYADHIVSLTHSATIEIQSWRISDTPISVIPTCVDMQLFNPETTASATSELRQSLCIEGEYVLAYLGSWGTWYMTDEVLDFFSSFIARCPNSRLLVLTPDEPDLSRYPHVSRTVVRKVSRREVPSYLGLANASICFIKPVFSKKASSATKIAESWAMNLPVVTNPGWGDIERLHNAGLPLFLCESKADHERTVSWLIDMRGMVKNKRGMLIGEFDLESGVRRYKSIYQSLSRS